VVSNPEFLKEGGAVEDFMRPDRIVVGAEDARAIALLRQLYAPFQRNRERIIVMGVRSAELTKYAANAMLATRISFMNEVANLCDAVGADVSKVRHAVGKDSRIGASFLFPGVGYGGSCFPKDIKALVRVGRDHGVSMRVVEAVDRANDAQKIMLVPRLEAALGGLAGKVVAIWGLAFKPKTDDMREAPALAIIEALLAKGASVRAYDPKAMHEAKRALEDRVTFCARSYEALEGADALVVVTEWNEFREPDFARMKKLLRRPVIFDGRNIYDPAEMERQGFEYQGIGRR
jgi:UDPglucose 6-dehydrogenase